MMRNNVVSELTVIFVFLSSANGLLFCQSKKFSEQKTRTLQDTTLAAEYFAKGEALYEAGKYDSSNTYYGKTKEIYEQLSERHDLEMIWTGMVQCHNKIGWNFMVRGEYERSMQLLNQALEIGIERLTENHLAVAKSYHNIGVVYWYQGKYDRALQTYQQSLGIRLRLLGEDHLYVARSYNNIGLTYWDMGDQNRALEYYQKCLTISLRLLGEEHSLVAGSYNNIGLVYMEKGDYDRALEYYQKDLSINLQLLGEDHPDVASSYNNIGVIYHHKGEYDRALEYHQKSLSTNLRLFGEDHLYVTRSYSNIGSIYQNEGEYDRALEYQLKSLRIRLRLFGEDHPEVAITYNHLGKIYNEQGDYEQAIEYHQRALTIAQKSLGNFHPEIANYYRDLADAHFGKNDFNKALTYCQKSLISLASGFDDASIYSNPSLGDISNTTYLLINTLALKAKVLTALSEQTGNRDLEMSLTTYHLTAELIDKIRTGYRAEGSKLLLSEDAKEIYERAIETSLLLAAAKRDERFKQKALHFAELAKAAILESELRAVKATRLAGIPGELASKSRDLSSKLVDTQTELLNEQQKVRGDSLKIVRLQFDYFALKNERQALLERIEQSYPKYYELRYQKRPIDVTALQQTLDDDTALLEYIVGDSTLYIFVVTKDFLEIETVPIAEDFTNEVRKFYTSIRRVLDRKNYVTKAFELYEILIRPVESHLASKEKLIIIPDEELFFVPFSALLTEEVVSGRETDFSKLKYLLYDYDISYHYSARLFLNKAKTAHGDYLNQFVGFAPVFSAENENGYLLSSNQPVFRSFMDFEGAPTRDGKKFEELKYSEKEVREIVELFKAHKQSGMGYFHQQASEDNFKHNIRTHQIVHVSTHGVVNHEQPELSALAFSQPRDSQHNEDGILYAGESFNLDLTTDLLVLSSCESGIGKLAKGEGVLSLTRGFLYSGAQNIITSLWKVFDQHTSQLMLAFYRNLLSGQTYSAALRSAKLELIKNRLTAHPASWASFVLVGG